MAMDKKKRLFLILTPFIIVVVGLGIISSLLLRGGDILVFKVNSPVNVVDKIHTAEKQGGTAELTEADFNAILELSMRNKTLSGNLIVKGMYSQITEGKLKVYVPVSYRGFTLLISSSGDLVYNEGQVIFKPNYIQVGKLHLPMKFVAKRLHSYSIAGGMVKDNGSVELPKQIFPFNLKNVTISGEKMVLVIDKVLPPPPQNLEQKLSGAQTEPSSPSSKVDLLKKAKSQLSGVYSAVKTAPEKAVIGQMQSVVAKMADNPAYLYTAESQSVKSQYNGLTSDEKSDIKVAILMNMDTGTLREIKGTFGL